MVLTYGQPTIYKSSPGTIRVSREWFWLTDSLRLTKVLQELLGFPRKGFDLWQPKNLQRSFRNHYSKSQMLGHLCTCLHTNTQISLSILLTSHVKSNYWAIGFFTVSSQGITHYTSCWARQYGMGSCESVKRDKT